MWEYQSPLQYKRGRCSVFAHKRHFYWYKRIIDSDKDFPSTRTCCHYSRVGYDAVDWRCGWLQVCEQHTECSNRNREVPNQVIESDIRRAAGATTVSKSEKQYWRQETWKTHRTGLEASTHGDTVHKWIRLRKRHLLTTFLTLRLGSSIVLPITLANMPLRANAATECGRAAAT